jgi:hypothetical protein
VCSERLESVFVVGIYIVGREGSVLYSYMMVVKVNRSLLPPMMHLHPYLSKYDDE